MIYDAPKIVHDALCFDGGDEPANHEDFSVRIARDGLFTFYHEVTGYYTQPRLDSENGKQPRIDFMLLPTKKLLDLGWNAGAVGVEIKAGGVKIGPAIAQSIDYSRAVFRICNPDGRLIAHVMPSMVFLYPVNRSAYNTTASIMAQNRIGLIRGGTWSLLTFKLGETNILDVSNSGNVSVKDSVVGYKRGSR